VNSTCRVGSQSLTNLDVSISSKVLLNLGTEVVFMICSKVRTMFWGSLLIWASLLTAPPRRLVALSTFSPCKFEILKSLMRLVRASDSSSVFESRLLITMTKNKGPPFFYFRIRIVFIHRFVPQFLGTVLFQEIKAQLEVLFKPNFGCPCTVSFVGLGNFIRCHDSIVLK
jgi:hypothetical protein